MIRYTLGLEFKCRTSNGLSALEIFTIKQLYQISQLIIVKLLHRDETSKYILEAAYIQENSYPQDSFCQNVGTLAADMQTDLKDVICYPDRVMEKVKSKFNRTPETDEIQVLLKNFNLNNRIKLKNLPSYKNNLSIVNLDEILEFVS